MNIGSRRMRRHRINRKRLTLLLTLLLLFIFLFVLVQQQYSIYHYYYYIRDFDARHLSIYFETADEEGIPWYYLAAVDRAEAVSDSQISYDRCSRIAAYLDGAQGSEEVFDSLKAYRDDEKFHKRIKTELEKLDYIITVYDNKVFPIKAGANYDYSDGYGDARSYGGERNHEGIDIMCSEGTPLVSVCDGVIEKMGWLELGGRRIGIRGEDGVYYYYAHLSKYREGLSKGDKVKKGELIGYAGDTGYGPEGTTGQFLPHLHFGMYEKEGFANIGERAVNPFPFLKVWEKNYAN